MLWSAGVSRSCMEQGGMMGHSCMCIAGSLITKSLIQNPGANVQDILDDLWHNMNEINSDDGLHKFMHHENKQKCLCMQHVAAEVAKKKPKKCLFCGAAMNKPQRCSRCKKAHYCDVDCQKKAWKMHKKVCEPAGMT